MRRIKYWIIDAIADSGSELTVGRANPTGGATSIAKTEPTDERVRKINVTVNVIYERTFDIEVS